MIFLHILSITIQCGMNRNKLLLLYCSRCLPLFSPFSLSLSYSLSPSPLCLSHFFSLFFFFLFPHTIYTLSGYDVFRYSREGCTTHLQEILSRCTFFVDIFFYSITFFLLCFSHSGGSFLSCIRICHFCPLHSPSISVSLSHTHSFS